MTNSKPPEQRDVQGQEKWYERMRYQILLFIGGIALFVLFGGWILDWYIAPQTSAQKKDLVQALGLITAGVAGAVGIIFTWRGQRLTQKGLQDTLRTTREGQITDRFTRAIDQLGKVEDGQKLFEIRVGGIYALERIARESEEDYYWPIMEILTAYVRQNAPWPPEVGQERTEDVTDEQRAMEGSGGKSETTEPAGPDPDIQAIMTILRRRKRRYMHGEPEALDLHKSNLSGANLREANLSGANLKAANLRKADLRKADLRGASFWLRGAKFWKANLREARLNEADLREANLNEADLREADLSGANLSGARFSKADFRGADLRGADLSGARSLTQAQLDEQGIKGDKDTQLPSPLKPPRHWGVKTDEQNEES
jgi:hypothetical protein